MIVARALFSFSRPGATVREQQDRVTAMLDILAADWVVIVKAERSAVQRDIVVAQARVELKGLMHEALQSAVQAIRGDIARLTPYSWNVFGSQARAEMARVNTDVDGTSRIADEEISRPESVTEVKSGNRESALKVKTGEAMRQLRQINSTKVWKNQ